MSSHTDRNHLLLAVAAAVRAWPGTKASEIGLIVKRSLEDKISQAQITRAIQSLFESGDLKRKKTGKTASFEPCFIYFPTDRHYPPALPIRRKAPRLTYGFPSSPNSPSSRS